MRNNSWAFKGKNVLRRKTIGDMETLHPSNGYSSSGGWMAERSDGRPGKICLLYQDYLEDIHRPMVILFQEVELELGRERSLQLVSRAGDRLGREMALNQLKGRPINDFDDFRTFWGDLMSSPLFSATQEVEIVEEGDHHLKMRVSRCLWAEYFQRLGDTELGYLVCCNADHQMLSAYNLRLSLRRTKTIMQGDDHCDHCFIWSD
jgi:hypothetical protein